MKTRTFSGIKAIPPLLANELRGFFEGSGHEVQVRYEKEMMVVQARKTQRWRDFVGLSSALTIQVMVIDDDTQVSVGNQRWLDKALVVSLGMLIPMNPVALTAVYGTYNQYRLAGEAWETIERHIARVSEPGAVLQPTATSASDPGPGTVARVSQPETEQQPVSAE